VVELRKLASRNDPDLATKLERILKLEAVLAPAAALFDLLLARNGKSPADIAANIRQRWGRKIPNLSDEGYADLRDEIRRCSSVEVEAAINSFNATLVQGDFEGAIKALLDWNNQVMARRGGGPWATLNARRVLDVGMPTPEKPMPEKGELGSLWRNDYFFSSLRGITRQLAA
jgi:hypothetical protein